MNALLEALLPHGTSLKFSKGSTVLYQSEIPRGAFIIKKGLVRAYTITSSGEERIISLYAKNDIFPLPWIYGKAPGTLFYYEASNDSELVCVPKNAFLTTISNNPNLMECVVDTTVNEYTGLLLRITALEQSMASEKIALTLYYLMMRHGVQKKNGEYFIDVKMTQAMIASLVGLTRESTAVNLNLLKKKKIIAYSHFTYTINRTLLEKFIGEDSFKDLALN
jgi:CRP-like cAMP-binding protein